MDPLLKGLLVRICGPFTKRPSRTRLWTIPSGLATLDLEIDCAWGSSIHRFPFLLWEDRRETDRSDLSSRHFCHRSPFLLWEDRHEKDRSDLFSPQLCHRALMTLWEDRHETNRAIIGAHGIVAACDGNSQLKRTRLENGAGKSGSRDRLCVGVIDSPLSISFVGKSP